MLTVFWVVLAAGAVISATAVLSGTAVLAAFPLYAVAGRYPPRTSLVALGVALAVVVAIGVVPGLPGTGTAGGQVVPAAAIVVAAWALGIAKRNHREKAVTEERLRLARELHDVISHGLGAITVHAGVARQVLPTHPEEVPTLIASIEESAREGTRDLRRLLDALRGVEQPAPTLDDVLAGTTATVDIRGQRRPLPGNVEEVAFRVVREALTNVAKHASGATTLVVLDYRPGELLMEITDDGPGGPVTAGHGITGMRERVEACGGKLTVTAQERGVRVAAVLPTGETR